MNYKKYLILFLSIFILIACKKLPVDDIQKQVDKKIYYDALYLMNEKFEKSTPSKEDLDRYQKIYNDGRKYFLSKSGTLKDRSQFYQDGREETLSDKERFFREMAIKILREINQELKKLPDYDFMKIYIS